MVPYFRLFFSLGNITPCMRQEFQPWPFFAFRQQGINARTMRDSSKAARIRDRYCDDFFLSMFISIWNFTSSHNENQATGHYILWPDLHESTTFAVGEHIDGSASLDSHADIYKIAWAVKERETQLSAVRV